MKRLIYTPQAIRDIDGIWDYTAERWGIDQAELYVSALRDACYVLMKYENMDQNAGAIRAGYRKLKKRLAFHLLPSSRR